MGIFHRSQWSANGLSTPSGYYRPRSEASEGYVFTGVRHSLCTRGWVTSNSSWGRPHGLMGGRCLVTPDHTTLSVQTWSHQPTMVRPGHTPLPQPDLVTHLKSPTPLPHLKSHPHPQGRHRTREYGQGVGGTHPT